MLTSFVICLLLAAYSVHASSADKVEKDSSPPPTKCHAVLITPKPDNTACGLHGVLKKPDAITSVSYQDTANPFAACRRQCLGLKSCISFAFDKTDGSCVIYAKHLESMEIQRKKNDIVYYNHNCFTTTCTTTSPTPTPTLCGDTPYDTTFNLQVLQDGGLLSGYYAAMFHRDGVVSGNNYLAEAGSEDVATTFTFSPSCDLVGYDNSEDPYYAQPVNPYFSQSSSDYYLDIADASYYYDKYKSQPGYPGLICGLNKGALSCGDPSDASMVFYTCMDTSQQPSISNPLLIAKNLPPSNPPATCVGLAMTTTQITPTAT